MPARAHILISPRCSFVHLSDLLTGLFHRICPREQPHISLAAIYRLGSSSPLSDCLTGFPELPPLPKGPAKSDLCQLGSSFV